MYSVAPTVFMLLQLFLGKGFSHVPAPVNVTIQCHNFRTVAYWNYSRPSLHPRFIVELFPYSGVSLLVTSCFNITHHHCNVSKQVLLSIQDSYFLTVKAVVGVNQSEPAESPEFTYNINKIEQIHCSVDFPPVNLSESSDGMLKLEFPHPFHFYRGSLQHITPQQRKYYKSFTYKVLSGDRSDHPQKMLDCRSMNGLCEADVEKLEETCIWLDGWMNNIHIAAAEEVCLQEHNQVARAIQTQKGHLSLVVPLVSAGAAMVVFAVCAVLVVRRKTNGSTVFPKIMASMLANPQLARQLLQPETDRMSEVLSVAPRADSEQESPDDHVPTGTLIPEEGSRFPIGKVTGRSGSFSEGQTYDRVGRLEVQSRSEEEEQGSRSKGDEQENSTCRGVESSGYDRPHVSLTFEISPGDRVQGYKLSQA